MTLRDLYAAGTPELQSCLKKFRVGKAKLIDVKAYRMLTPDSFIWKLRMSDGIYYLYAEDYVPSMDHIREEIAGYTHDQKGHFIEAKNLREIPAVRAAATYAESDDYALDMAKLAVGSGYDLVFLFKVDELSEADKAEL